MLSTRSVSNVHYNFSAAYWRDSNADPSLVWSWLLLLHAGGCHQVCHHDCHQVLLCHRGYKCYTLLSQWLHVLRYNFGQDCAHSDFVTGSLNTAKRVPLVKRRSLTFELMMNHHKCLIIFVSFTIQPEHLGRFEQ